MAITQMIGGSQKFKRMFRKISDYMEDTENNNIKLSLWGASVEYTNFLMEAKELKFKDNEISIYIKNKTSKKDINKNKLSLLANVITA